MLKQFLLAAALVAVPVAGFTAFEAFVFPHTAQAAGLGDLSAMQTIVDDVIGIADKGDLVAAEKRITDYETAWDEGEPTLRPKDAEIWGKVDMASDAALKALRAKTADSDKVKTTLANLKDVLKASGAAQ